MHIEVGEWHYAACYDGHRWLGFFKRILRIGAIILAGAIGGSNYLRLRI